MIARANIAAAARGWIGTPYLHQASAKGAGTDCLGLVRGVWRELYGVEPEAPPPYTPDWVERRAGEPLLSAARRHLTQAHTAQSGDVLLFRMTPGGPVKHAGILTQAERFVHAHQGRAVCEAWLAPWWRRRVAGVFSFPGAE